MRAKGISPDLGAFLAGFRMAAVIVDIQAYEFPLSARDIGFACGETRFAS
jgi:hypothetical protein